MDAILKYKNELITFRKVEKFFFNKNEGVISIKFEEITESIEIYSNRFWYQKIMYSTRQIEYKELLSIDLYLGNKKINIENGNVQTERIFSEVLA